MEQDFGAKNSAGDATRILAISTGVPPRRYGQLELLKHFGVSSEKQERFYRHEHVQHRHLFWAPGSAPGMPREAETNGEMLQRFRANARELGGAVIRGALERAGLTASEVGMLCCVTSTGFLVPGLSALLLGDLGLPPHCQRLDVVGMGCSAGLNGLNAVTAWCSANPGKNAVLACVEICSAIYSLDASENTALVNSLFGDGAAAAVVRREAGGKTRALARLRDFASFQIPGTADSLRFEWDEEGGRNRFVVEKETPRQIAAHIAGPVNEFLSRNGLSRKGVSHWIVHSGGAAILGGIEKTLELPPHALKYTREVLRDYGNVSSGSFLFSLERLLAAGEERPQGVGLMITMGPGLTVELALVDF